MSSYSLSHFIYRSDKMFCAALSITSDRQALTTIGPANIASLCQFHGIPVYLFANTLSSLPTACRWISVSMGKPSVSQSEDGDAYDLLIYSHDIMDLKMVDFLVTEDGIFSKEWLYKPKDFPSYKTLFEAHDIS